MNKWNILQKKSSSARPQQDLNLKTKTKTKTCHLQHREYSRALDLMMYRENER